MQRVVVWIERKGGVAEQHVGSFERWVRDGSGRALADDRGRPRPDESYAADVYERVKGFEFANAHDVAKALTAEEIEADETRVLRDLAKALLEIAERVQYRQERAAANKMRAPWLADIELAQMVVRVRGE